MILHQVIESDRHYHCLVIGSERTLLLLYSFDEGHYTQTARSLSDSMADQMTEMACRLSRVYGYDINMSEFVLKDDELYLINATNPSPLISRDLMTEPQYDWICNQIADLAARRAESPPIMKFPVRLTAG